MHLRSSIVAARVQRWKRLRRGWRHNRSSLFFGNFGSTFFSAPALFENDDGDAFVVPCLFVVVFFRLEPLDLDLSADCEGSSITLLVFKGIELAQQLPCLLARQDGQMMEAGENDWVPVSQLGPAASQRFLM